MRFNARRFTRAAINVGRFGQQQSVNAKKIKKAMDGGLRVAAKAGFRVARRNKLATGATVVGLHIANNRRKERNRRKKVEHTNTFYNNNYNRSFGGTSNRSFASNDNDFFERLERELNGD